MSEYRLTQGSSVIRTGDGACIPSDPGNSDWRAYQDWLSAGNVPEPHIEPPPPVPDLISDRQFFQQLAIQGVITQADALAAVKTGEIPAALQTLIDAMPQDQRFGATMIVAGATAFQRNHPLTLAIGQAYGWSSAQIDDLWRAAVQL
ncbi:hypothetical protein [Bradyrhizobium diazoefficiens]|uniref:hypothetical protein n=1 Tax=Bradyrhizobium diazoefficiens TaxID=1355477 RepID=UPI001B73F821|nr:hypothetical protein [Bradyrhizobium japonicum]